MFLNLIQNEYDTPNCVYSLSFHKSVNFLNYVIGYESLNIEHLYKDKLNDYIKVLEKELTDIKLPNEVIINYINDLKKEIPEVDAYFGKFDWKGILAELGKSYDEKLRNERHLTTPKHYAYLKISNF